MCASAMPLFPTDLQQTFVTLILPRVQAHARIKLADIRCRDKRADMMAEVTGLAWKWYRRLAARDKDATEFVSAIADFAVRHVRSGRRVCGMLNAKDAMNELTQQRHGFKVEALPSSTRSSHEERYAPGGQRLRDEYEERLHDNTRTPPDEQATFRIDFAHWLRTLTGRERRVIRLMATNETTKELSRRFDVSPGRISQMRREFKDEWNRFCGELPPREAMAESVA